MSNLIELLAGGLSLGAVYSLIALGFVVIFRATGAFNFAHGSFVIVGTLVIARLHDDIGFYPALLAGCAVAGVAAILVDRLLLRRMTGPEAVVPVALMMIGLDLVLTTEVRRNIGTADALPLGDPWGTGVLHVAGISLPHSRVAAIVVAAVLLAGFFLVFTRTDWGVGMRAAAEDPEAAQLMGIPLARVSMSAWVIGGVLATVAGVFLTSFPSPGLDVSVAAVALRALPAAMLGGLDSPGGAVVGGLSIGVAESLVGGYQEHLSLLGAGFSSVVPYVVLIAVLLWRPQGLFGAKEVRRV